MDSRYMFRFHSDRNTSLRFRPLSVHNTFLRFYTADCWHMRTYLHPRHLLKRSAALRYLHSSFLQDFRYRIKRCSFGSSARFSLSVHSLRYRSLPSLHIFRCWVLTVLSDRCRNGIQCDRLLPEYPGRGIHT